MSGTQSMSQVSSPPRSPTKSDAYFDHLETRQPEAREQALFNLLPGLIQRAITVAPGWAAHLHAA